MATFAPFNPVQDFQRGRQNALTIQGQEQGIAREASAAPIRDQLAKLGLQETEKGIARSDTQFDQEGALQKTKILNQTAKALRGLDPSQYAAAFANIEPQLQKFGIDTTQFKGMEITSEGLDQVIAETQGFLSDPDKLQKLGRLEQGIDAQGNPVFFQSGTETGQAPSIVQGITPPQSEASINRETKQLERDEKSELRQEAKKQQAGIVSFDINRALQQSENAFTTGFTGSIASAVPGTAAFDLRSTLDTIKANIGFDKLQSMRELSPTGGALGSVSENENRLLQSVLGSVEQSQSKDQLQFNLNRAQIIFDAIINGSAAIPFTEEQFNALPSGTRYIDPDDGQLHEKQ